MFLFSTEHYDRLQEMVFKESFEQIVVFLKESWWTKKKYPIKHMFF